MCASPKWASDYYSSFLANGRGEKRPFLCAPLVVKRILDKKNLFSVSSFRLPSPLFSVCPFPFVSAAAADSSLRNHFLRLMPISTHDFPSKREKKRKAGELVQMPKSKGGSAINTMLLSPWAQ